MDGVPVKVISGGRITLPQEIRADLELSEGDYVRVCVEKMGVADE